jgi:nucleoredoxin
MRFLLGSLLLFALAAFGFAGNLAPLSLKDVGLMLRGGYSSAAVEKELTERHFLGGLDAAGEKTLIQAGATPQLIGKLKSGAFTVSATAMAAAKAELAVKEQRRAVEQEESRKLNTLYQAQLAQERKVAAALTAANPSGAIASLVKGALVDSRNGVLRAHLDADLEKRKLIALYFSARWCPECRQFTPKLVAYYNKVAAAHPEFEVLFVSNDKSPSAMETYMRDEKMPWPALSYDKIAGNQGLLKYAGAGIPCLVVVDDTGKVIFDTYAGKNYRGPDAVLAELDQLFAGKGPAQLAQTR